MKHSETLVLRCVLWYDEFCMAYQARIDVSSKELCENNHCSMRRMNSQGQGGGVSHSGAMSNDDNVVMANSDKQNEVIIDA